VISGLSMRTEEFGLCHVSRLLADVSERGPITARQLVDPRPRKGEWWDRRSGGRQGLAWLYGRGKLATWRSSSFESLYDLPERVLPGEVLARPTPRVEAAQRALLLKAAHASGVGTVADIAGYHTLQPRTAKLLVAELVNDGELVLAHVEGWDEPGHLPAGVGSRRPTRTSGTLLSPLTR
jgi:uncharacterized protein YcaQ